MIRHHPVPPQDAQITLGRVVIAGHGHAGAGLGRHGRALGAALLEGGTQFFGAVLGQREAGAELAHGPFKPGVRRDNHGLARDGGLDGHAGDAVEVGDFAVRQDDEVGLAKQLGILLIGQATFQNGDTRVGLEVAGNWRDHTAGALAGHAPLEDEACVAVRVALEEVQDGRLKNVDPFFPRGHPQHSKDRAAAALAPLLVTEIGTRAGEQCHRHPGHLLVFSIGDVAVTRKNDVAPPGQPVEGAQHGGKEPGLPRKVAGGEVRVVFRLAGEEEDGELIEAAPESPGTESAQADHVVDPHRGEKQHVHRAGAAQGLASLPENAPVLREDAEVPAPARPFSRDGLVPTVDRVDRNDGEVGLHVCDDRAVARDKDLGPGIKMHLPDRLDPRLEMTFVVDQGFLADEDFFAGKGHTKS